MRNIFFLASLCWALVALPSHGITLSGESDADRDGLRPAGFVATITELSKSLHRSGPTVQTETKSERRAGRSARQIAPLARNLLPFLSARPFGSKERVTLEEGTDGLVIRCRAGSRPAGVRLEDPERALPNLGKVDLRVEAEHSGGFRLALHDPHKGEGQNLRSLGALPQGAKYMSLPAPNPVYGPRYPLVFSLLCPDSGGKARLDRLELLPNVSTGPLDRSLSA